MAVRIISVVRTGIANRVVVVEKMLCTAEMTVTETIGIAKVAIGMIVTGMRLAGDVPIRLPLIIEMNAQGLRVVMMTGAAVVTRTMIVLARMTGSEMIGIRLEGLLKTGRRGTPTDIRNFQLAFYGGALGWPTFQFHGVVDWSLPYEVAISVSFKMS